jgi:hypothetical protein
MNTKITKIIKAAVLTILVAFVLIEVVPIPIRIETQALEIIISDSSHVEERNIRISGWYNYHIIAGWHSFRGRIHILEYPETDSPFVFSPVRLQPHFGEFSLWGIRSELLMYESGLARIDIPGTFTGGYDFHSFGAIYTTPFFSRSAIMVRNNDGSLNALDSPVIVPNARTREEALAIIARLGLIVCF